MKTIKQTKRAGTVGTKKRKKYSAQFKDQAVDRALIDGVAVVARELGIAESMLYAWRTKREQGGQSIEQQTLQAAEIAKLKREKADLEQQVIFLKKVASYFNKEAGSDTK